MIKAHPCPTGGAVAFLTHIARLNMIDRFTFTNHAIVAGAAKFWRASKCAIEVTAFTFEPTVGAIKGKTGFEMFGYLVRCGARNGHGRLSLTLP